jgi:hypothetical protein
MKRTVTAIAILASLGLAGAAHSGVKENATVVVSTAAKIAYGSFGSARNSLDSYQKLYCWVWSFDDAGTPFESGGCYARDYNLSVSAMCGTTLPGLLQAIRGLNDDAYISFAWDVNGQCTSIKNHNGSMYAPKVN